MTKLVGSELLDATDAFLVEELHIVTGIAIQEIVSTYAKPEQVNLLIRIIGIVVNIGDVSRSERTVRTKVRELVEIRETIEQCLVATT